MLRLETLRTVSDSVTGREVFDCIHAGPYRLTVCHCEACSGRQWLTIWDRAHVVGHWEPVNGLSTDDPAQFAEVIDILAEACAVVWPMATSPEALQGALIAMRETSDAN